MNRYPVFVVLSYYLFTFVILITIISQGIESIKKLPYYSSGNLVSLVNGVACNNITDDDICFKFNIANFTYCDDYDSCGETMCKLLLDNPGTSFGTYFESAYGGEEVSPEYCHRQWNTKFKWTPSVILWFINCVCLVINIVLSYLVYKTSINKIYYGLSIIVLLQWLLSAISLLLINNSPMMITSNIVLISYYFIQSMIYILLSKSILIDRELSNGMYSQL